MYPNLGSGSTQPSAPAAPYPPPPSSSSSLANSAGQPVGFSSFTSQPPANTAPYPGGQPSQAPYPMGPPSSSSRTNPYAPNNPPPNTGGYPPYSLPPNNPPPNTGGGYSPYSLPQTGQQPPPPGQGGSSYQKTPYPPSSGPQQSYQSPYPPSSGYPSSNPAGQQPPPPPGAGGYQNPYPPSNSYQQQQYGGYPPNQQQQPFQNPYASPYPQGGYPQQNQQQPFQNPYATPYSQQNQQQPYQSPYSSPYPQQAQGGGYPSNQYGSSAINERLQAVAAKYEISNTLAQRLRMLEQFELVVLCDDSGSMNTPIEGTRGTRWDELRTIVQIIIEIGVVLDSNGVDVHFLNRPPMLNVTDPRRADQAFASPPAGLTPLVPALRRIFQSAASKPGSDKRLLVFVATDGAPTDNSGNVDIPSLESLMRNERQSNTTHVAFLTCTDDDQSVAYLSQWDRNMINVDVTDDFKTEREEVRRTRGMNFPFSFGDYIAKALLGAVDPQMDALDESGNDNYFGRR